MDKIVGIFLIVVACILVISFIVLAGMNFYVKHMKGKDNITRLDSDDDEDDE